VRVLLATDAASEGLNLQACSWLVNYDMPWNPMRVEQRIGRIDRIGQQEPVVEVRNYFVPGTIEERVYELLAERIDDFSELLGGLQPILGAAEDAVRSVFRAGRSERAAREKAELDALGQRIDELRSGGIDLSDDDPHPATAAPPAPVSLSELERRLSHLGIRLGTAGLPASSDPDRVSRDESDWCALATYGHPRLAEQLARVLDGDDLVGAEGGLVIARADGGVDDGIVVTAPVRDDRTPPEPVSSVQQIGELGRPVSTTEAEWVAIEMARHEAMVRAEQLRATNVVGLVRQKEGITRRFLRLVHRAIATECTLEREEKGMAPSPGAVWIELQRRDDDWRYAGGFCQRLGLTVDDVAPARLAEPSAFLPGWPKRPVWHERAAELRGLMAAWKDLGLG
jgi:hypothetical protein